MNIIFNKTTGIIVDWIDGDVKLFGLNSDLSYVTVEYSGDQSETNISEITNSETQIQNDKIEKLWNIANDYQQSQLDANAMVGISNKARDGGNKAQDNIDWVQSIWDLYYSRKQEILNNYMYDVSYDFSSLGDLPYNYYEAMSEEIT